MKLTGLLKSRKTFNLLLVLNFITAVVVFFIFKSKTGGDTQTYFGLADGILHGSYSYWYFLDQYYPDTFRNPGYPLFLAAIRLFTHSILVVQLIQFIFYFAAIRLVMSIVDLLYKDTIVIKNLFLLFLLPSIHVASYIPTIFPEILVTYLILLAIWIDLKQPSGSWKKYIILGLLYGVIFQIRPVIMFLPFLIAILNYIRNRQTFPIFKNVVLLSIFVLTMVPYGLWNKKNHGVFKVTSLEGGGGVFHLGYWMFKLPDYYEPRYWGNYCTRELIPFIDENEKDHYIQKYNVEWDEIDAATAPFLTAADTAMIAVKKNYPSLFKTYNSNYTMKREALLKEYALKNIKADLPFYIKAKCYSAVRLWVTGIPLKEFGPAGTAKKIYLMYPFLITLTTFIAALIFLPIAFIKFRPAMLPLIVILMITLYFGIMHIPFTIQSRYTIPVRLELLMMIAVAVYVIFFKNQDTEKNTSAPN